MNRVISKERECVSKERECVSKERECVSKERECVCKESGVVQQALGIASNTDPFKERDVSFKTSQRVEEEPKFCLSENKRSTVEIPVDKTGATVDCPEGTATVINEGSPVLRRTEVISKETEITFGETDIARKAVEAPLLFKEVGKSTSEGLLIFIQTEIIVYENIINPLFKGGEKSDSVESTEAAVPLTETHRTSIDSPVY